MFLVRKMRRRQQERPEGLDGNWRLVPSTRVSSVSSSSGTSGCSPPAGCAPCLWPSPGNVRLPDGLPFWSPIHTLLHCALEHSAAQRPDASIASGFSLNEALTTFWLPLGLGSVSSTLMFSIPVWWSFAQVRMQHPPSFAPLSQQLVWFQVQQFTFFFYRVFLCLRWHHGASDQCFSKYVSPKCTLANKFCTRQQWFKAKKEHWLIHNCIFSLLLASRDHCGDVISPHFSRTVFLGAAGSPQRPGVSYTVSWTLHGVKPCMWAMDTRKWRSFVWSVASLEAQQPVLIYFTFLYHSCVWEGI